MIQPHQVKVFFIKLQKQNINTASENRFWGIYKMTSFNFESRVIQTKNISKSFQKFKLINAVSNRLRIIQATFSLLQFRNKKNINVIYLFNIDPLLAIYYYIFGRCFNIFILSERNELPSSILKLKRKNEWINRKLLYPWYYKIFDGYTLISEELIKHYNPFLSKRQIIRKLPMTVDFDRFNNITSSSLERYIFYSGSLNNKKDGIDYLIEAFINAQIKLQNVSLVIASNASEKETFAFKEYIERLGNNKIKVLHSIDRTIIPQYMIDSSVCILPRPDSPQARGGFPTKLGEYLASGTPVIVSDVGEIRHYLDSSEVYFISPSKIVAEIESTLLKIFQDYDDAIKKGLSGRKKAYSQFSLNSNSSIICDFIISVVSRKK